MDKEGKSLDVKMYVLDVRTDIYRNTGCNPPSHSSEGRREGRLRK
jgi:hypothetical protein